MDGEKVLPVKEAPLLNPIFRQGNQVWFELQNVRPGKNLRDALEIDFAFDGEISGPIHVVVHTNGKRLRFPIQVGSLTGHQGVLKCSYDSVSDNSPMGADLEVYVELSEMDSMPAAFAASYSKLGSIKTDSDPLYFKVSKSATRGNVETLTYGRQMRESEQRIFLQRRKKYGPPPQPPKGTMLLADDVMLVPGTPIVAAFEGDWRTAEVLASFPKGGWVVHWPQLGHKANTVLTATHIALTENTIATLRNANGTAKFKPSAVLTKGSLQPPPEGYAVLPTELEVVPGTPVKVFMGGSYWDYTVVENGATAVPLISNSFARRSEEIDRSQIIIEKAIDRRLSEPKLRAEFADRLKTILAANPPALGKTSTAKSYAATQQLPVGHGKASASTQLKVGDRGLVFWGNSWLKVLVTALTETGDVEIQWDGWSIREVVTRDSLAVSENILGNKQAASKETKSSKDPSPTKDAENTGAKKESNSSSVFVLTLESPGQRKIQIAKMIMSLTKMSLIQANEVVENTPIELRNDLSEKDALRWQKQLELIGAKVSVSGSDKETRR